jgi:hypothetical protein
LGADNTVVDVQRVLANNKGGPPGMEIEPATATTALVGRVTSDDPENPRDGNGLADFGMVVGDDWLRFDSFYRAWGKAGTGGLAFPNSSQQGACTSGSCQIWDWRLKAADTSLRAVNGTFQENVACPSAVNGNAATSDLQGNTFLTHATEIIGDTDAEGQRVGDDDGLCESSERCVFSANRGAYQGEEPVSTGTCIFTGGTVAGVTVYGRLQNGVP